MATDLPIAGTVHPESATAAYMKTFGLDGSLGTNSPELLAERLLALYDPTTWRFYSDMSRKGFLAAQREKGSLASWMQDAATKLASV
jgi:hypothetical protein